MTRKNQIICVVSLLLIIIIGNIILSEKILYLIVYQYHRIINGHTFTVNDTCYSVPDGWFIRERSNSHGDGGYVLLRKEEGKWQAASAVIDVSKRYSPTEYHVLAEQFPDGVKVYHAVMRNTNEQSPFFARNDSDDMVFLGDSIEIVRHFVLQSQPTVCKQ